MRYDLDEILNKAYSDEHAKENVKPSYALNQETISKMREQSNMNKRKLGFRLNKVAKLAVACTCVCVIAGLTTVTYSAIKKHFNSTIEMDNGYSVELSADVQYKNIPNDVLKVDAPKELQWNDIEDMLGFTLLGSGDAENEMVVYDTHINTDGTVAVVDMYVPIYKKYGEPSHTEEGDEYYKSYISLMVDILDENAEEGYILPFAEGKDEQGGKALIDEYYSESLGTKVVLYETGEGITASLIYDNVYYSIQGHGVTEEQIKDAVEGLK